MTLKLQLALGLLILLPAFSSAAPAPEDAFGVNQALSPGLNYGAIFDAKPPEGWGLLAKEGDFKIMAAAGFKSVRLPVRWSAKAAESEPYALDPLFLARVDSMVQAALDQGLYVVLDFHNFEELMADPQGQEARFLGIWKQLSAHYRSYPKKLLFEILNEPHDKLTPELWNRLYPKALALIRRDNPDRLVFLGTADWGGAKSLAALRPPEQDRNLILSFHDYAPFHFTHQGAEWVGPQSQAWLGTRWTGSYAQREELRRDFAQAAAYAKARQLPLNLGEFGANAKADQASRVLWTAAMAGLARRFGFSSMYWEFKSGNFGVYDEKRGTWRMDLRDALLK
jgi:endoglucanase